MNVFVFGLGFSAQATLRALEAMPGETPHFAGTTRSPEQQAALAERGIAAHLFDGGEAGPDLLSDLSGATHVLLSIPPGEGGDPVLGLTDTLDRAEALEWIGYFSTVGVYGDHGGAWIDETAPLNPQHPRSVRRVDAENAWRAYADGRGVPLMILRLAGIYGPGRSAFDKIRTGRARRIVKRGQVFNRIHVEDIGRMTALAMTRNLAGTFNLADDEPAPPQDVVTYAAGLAHVKPPPAEPFEAADMTPMARTFYSSNERVSNAAIKTALGVELVYPTYRHGLAAIHAAAMSAGEARATTDRETAAP